MKTKALIKYLWVLPYVIIGFFLVDFATAIYTDSSDYGVFFATTASAVTTILFCVFALVAGIFLKNRFK